jgi:predicted TIM-barrel fold metal-dependent hydrolase
MYLRANGLTDTQAVNNAVAAYCDRAPDRFIAGVGVVEPLYGAAGFDEVRRCAEELGLAGIGFHNGMQGVPVDSPLMRGLIEKIGDAGMIPFIHALGNDLENIWQVESLAKDFPDLPIVVLDVFQNIGQVKAIPDIAERRPNLLFDLVFTPCFDLMGLPQVRAVGADRFLYGSNFYSWPTMKKPFGILLEEILASDLDDADKAAILGGNIKRLLGPARRVASRAAAISSVKER